jgi:hypothetical protein
VLVYVECISRNPGVSAEAFRYVVGSMQAGWEGRAGEDDALLLDVGRTWRGGPEDLGHEIADLGHEIR